jgi:hypothetical protein
MKKLCQVVSQRSGYFKKCTVGHAARTFIKGSDRWQHNVYLRAARV